MDSRKSFVDCLNYWVEYRRKALFRSKVHMANQPGFHKELAELPLLGKVKLFWRGNDVDFIELVNALYEIGVIHSDRFHLTKKDLMLSFESFFNIKIKNAEIKLNKARDRKRDAAPFLEKLKQVFINGSESKVIRKQ